MTFDLPLVVGEIGDGVLRDSEDAAITAPYVLAPCWVAVDGQVVARDPQVAARVYRVASGPIRIRRHVAEAACTTAAGSRRHR